MKFKFKPIQFNSIKFEISILYTLILGLILILFSGILSFMSTSFFKGLDTELKIKAQTIERVINIYLDAASPGNKSLAWAVERTILKGPIQAKRKTQNWTEAAGLNFQKEYVNLATPDGTIIFSSPNMDQRLRDFFMEDSQFFKSNRIVYRTATYKEENIRIIYYPVHTRSGEGFRLQVGVVQDPIMRLMLNWLYSVAIAVPLILLLTSFVGRMLASRILTPVKEITAAANNITHRDLSARVKTSHFDVEMQALVEAFNDMISRLEKSFKHIEEFSYHVAHELKTPLTIIRGEAELVLRKERTSEEYKKGFRIVLEETERMLKTVEDLLLLTKLDYQPEAFKFEEFNFVEFYNDVCEQAKMMSLKKNIKLECDLPHAPIPIIGARLHLRRLFFNIIDNAIKFTPEGGRVYMKVTSTPDTVKISISDNGPGIEQADIDKIFNRFFSMNKAANGLGLNIAQTIAKLHKGRITVTSVLGEGATFTVILPRL
jgi:signal transduction histidine kinase